MKNSESKINIDGNNSKVVINNGGVNNSCISDDTKGSGVVKYSVLITAFATLISGGLIMMGNLLNPLVSHKINKKSEDVPRAIIEQNKSNGVIPVLNNESEASTSNVNVQNISVENNYGHLNVDNQLISGNLEEGNISDSKKNDGNKNANKDEEYLSKPEDISSNQPPTIRKISPTSDIPSLYSLEEGKSVYLDEANAYVKLKRDVISARARKYAHILTVSPDRGPTQNINLAFKNTVTFTNGDHAYEISIIDASFENKNVEFKVTKLHE